MQTMMVYVTCEFGYNLHKLALWLALALLGMLTDLMPVLLLHWLVAINKNNRRVPLQEHTLVKACRPSHTYSLQKLSSEPSSFLTQLL